MTKYEYGVSVCFVASLNNDVVKHIYSDKAQAENEVRYLRVKYPKGRFKLYEREYHEWQEIDL